MRRWENKIHSSRGRIRIRSCSTSSAVFPRVSPSRFATARHVGIDDQPAEYQSPCPEHDVRGLPADAVQRHQLFDRAGTSPLNVSTRSRCTRPGSTWSCSGRTRSSGSSPRAPPGGARDRGGAGYRANSVGVTMLTRASVHCADRIVDDQQLERGLVGEGAGRVRIRLAQTCDQRRDIHLVLAAVGRVEVARPVERVLRGGRLGQHLVHGPITQLGALHL